MTLLATAALLAEKMSADDFKDIQNVLFAFFNGEAFDYIGYGLSFGLGACLSFLRVDRKTFSPLVVARSAH